MDGQQSRTLADHTTLRVGGPADAWVIAHTDDALVGAVRRCDEAGTPVLLLGGGSNLLVADDGFRGTVVQVATRGIEVLEVADDTAEIRVAAGEAWDDVVAFAVRQGWSGIEALSGIPGSAGATPVQNVGAYGQDIAQVLDTVRVLDRATGQVVDLGSDDCTFGYRTSRFKAERDCWVVLSVTLRLGTSGHGTVTYPELAGALGMGAGGTAPVDAIREAVLGLRGRKGMVLEVGDHDTWSAGSFFTNPVVSSATADSLPVDCPRYPAPEGVKLSAAWLIEQAGVSRGFCVPGHEAARISSRHTLALTNRGGASADDLLVLARAVRARVEDRFGIELVPEPVLVDLEL